MGTGCSKSVVVVSNSTWKPDARSSASNTSTTTTGSTLRTLAEATIDKVTARLRMQFPNNRTFKLKFKSTKVKITGERALIHVFQCWSPFKLSRTEAEELLSRAEPGAFVFSHDMTSELFLSISAGKYVCHHAVLTRDQGYYVGARRFTTIGDVVDYFKDHPLGETTLKQEFRTLPRCTSQVQIKHHPDITIPCPATIQKPGQYELLEKDQPFSTVQTSFAVESQSPKITLTSHLRSAEEKTLTEEDGNVSVSMDTDQQQSSKVDRRVDAMTKKTLTRGMAIERTDSSGEFQETALSPPLPSRSPAVKS